MDRYMAKLMELLRTRRKLEILARRWITSVSKSSTPLPAKRVKVWSSFFRWFWIRFPSLQHAAWKRVAFELLFSIFNLAYLAFNPFQSSTLLPGKRWTFAALWLKTLISKSSTSHLPGKVLKVCGSMLKIDALAVLQNTKWSASVLKCYLFKE